MAIYLIVCITIILLCALICGSILYHNLQLNKFQENYYQDLYIKLSNKIDRAHSTACDDCKKILYPIAYGRE